MEHQRALEKNINTSMQHVKDAARLEQERKVNRMRLASALGGGVGVSSVQILAVLAICGC